MTGMDVLRRVRAYEKDMALLKLRLSCARDAAMRITRSTDTTGHGGAEDKLGEYAAKVDEIERKMQARREQYEKDITTVGRLLDWLDAEQGSVLYMKMVQGKSLRLIGRQAHCSESKVKKLLREGRAKLDAIIVEE